jgi:hypothetical protein
LTAILKLSSIRGVYGIAANIELNSWQGTPRWTGYRPAGSQLEITLMTRTVDHVLVEPGNDGARQMRAFLAICEHDIARWTDEYARVLFARVCEREDAADRNLAEPRDSFERRLASRLP